MRHIRYSQIRIKDSSMMPIEKVVSELEDFDKEVLILVILEICSVECLEVDFDEEEQGEKPKEMIWKSRLKSVLKKPFWE